jgi:hypothetical protein
VSSVTRRELDDLILHLKGLVHVQALLADGGAPAAVLEAHATEVDRLRMKLARLGKESGEERWVPA